MSVPTEVESFQKERLQELSEKPNTTVFTVEHDVKNEPWPAARLRGVMETITARVLATPDDVTDFALRKNLLGYDEEILAFQRQHPKFYWLLTDRAIMREKKSRDAVTGMLFVRDEIERGRVAEGQEADAMATRTVIEALK
jgi:hypothetical protein